MEILLKKGNVPYFDQLEWAATTANTIPWWLVEYARTWFASWRPQVSHLYHGRTMVMGSQAAKECRSLGQCDSSSAPCRHCRFKLYILLPALVANTRHFFRRAKEGRSFWWCISLIRKPSGMNFVITIESEGPFLTKIMRQNIITTSKLWKSY